MVWIMIALVSLVNLSFVTAIDPGETWTFTPEHLIYRAGSSEYAPSYVFPVMESEDGYEFPFDVYEPVFDEERRYSDLIQTVEFEDEEFLTVTRSHSGESRGVFYSTESEWTSEYMERPAGLPVTFLKFTSQEREQLSIELYWDGQVVRARERVFFFDTIGSVEVIYRVESSLDGLEELIPEQNYKGSTDILIEFM